MIILSAKDLTKTYGVDVILDKVSFHVNEGDRIGIVGANGAGKTTLLNILSGRLPADGGQFYVSQNTTIGYLRQKDNLIKKTPCWRKSIRFSPIWRLWKKRCTTFLMRLTDWGQRPEP